MRTSSLKKREFAPGVVNIRTLCAFDEYATTVSWIQVTKTCILSMAPAFAAMMLIELMPLAPVNVGWAENWVLWVRWFFTGVFGSLGICTQFRASAPAAGVSTRSIALISISSASGCVLGLLSLARYWAFPVPFSTVVSCPVWLTCLFGSSVIVIGWKNIRSNKILREQLGRMLLLTSAQAPMMLIYPAYSAGFIALSGATQLAFILVLPAIKYFMKWLLNRTGNHTTSSNVLVMTSVDFFEALYLLKCMQSAGSIQSGLSLIVVDLVQNVVHLRGLHQKVHTLEQRLSDDASQLDGRNLVRSFICMSQTSSSPTPDHVRRPSRNAISPLLSKSSMPTVAVLPIPHLAAMSTNELNAAVESFFLECQEVLLVEFIETITPVFYVLYSVILFHLPNAKYYPEMQTMTIEKLSTLVGNIAIYAGLEFLSLIYVHLILKWRFNLSAMHLLAFMLQSERAAFQTIFVNWAVVNLQCTLVHYGVDYSFRFAWLTSTPADINN